MSNYGVFPGPYFPAFGLNPVYLSVFSPNAGKYGPEKTPYLNNFHAVKGTSVLKYAERKCFGRTGWLQILKSEKCTLPLKEWMAASIL